MKRVIICAMFFVGCASSFAFAVGCGADTNGNAPVKPDAVATAETPAPAVETATAETPAPKTQDGEWGHLTGQIVVSGAVPENAAEDVKDNKDKDVCLVDGKIPLDDGIVVNADNQIRDVFVMMYLGRGAEEPTAFHPSYEAKKAEKLTIDNVKCRFVPKAMFARSGQTLILKNSDNVGHNCRITTLNQGHNVNIVKNDSAEVTLDDISDKVPGEVKCDMHQWMDGVLLIRDNPYVAISNETGKFTIENVPAGDWKFQFWHKKAGYLKTIEIKDFEVDKRGCIEASVKNGETLDLGTLTLPGDALSK